ncbi:capsular polysaccharide export protein, LipB/KpsS family [Thiomicrorhabdus heinhorstiae]|uniref:Capsular biosynthesis protein n=1 Tax=Thiomicrorhabdus heinhorstiae TaxID=2748010 RepID=A0ABS0C3B7_9GAMM|nr:hypothetical protein [Thiomicrorhabdus heinhorstiae]MBF6058636.1 hypothetical protein [Thiomicrorhabdus heinhorstiae]
MRNNSIKHLFISHRGGFNYFDILAKTCFDGEYVIIYDKYLKNNPDPDVVKKLKGLDLSRALDFKLTEKLKKNPKLNWLYSMKWAQKIYKRKFRKKAELLAIQVDKYLKEYPSIEFVWLWNDQKPYSLIVKSLVKDLPVRCIYMENGWLPNSTQMNLAGVNCSSDLNQNLSFYQEYAKQGPEYHLEGRLPTRNFRLTHLSKEGVTELPERYFFVPFQVDYDTQIIAHSPWITDMLDLFEKTSNVLSKLGVNVVYKLHPSSSVDYSDLMVQAENRKNVFFANQVDTETLVNQSQAVITINSTVGFEGVLLNKPVICLGKAFYQFLCLRATDSESLNAAVKKVVAGWDYDQEARHGLLSYLSNEFLVEGDWRKPDEQHFQSVRNKLEEFESSVEQ